MSATLLGALATAGALGVTHAVEPDHVAGIASLTGRYGDARLSALVGACFSLGHVALVVGWLGVGYVVLRRTEFPAVFDTVAAYAVSIPVTMSALGAGAGAVFEQTSRLNARVYGGAQALAGVLVVAIAVSVLAGAVPLFG